MLFVAVIYFVVTRLYEHFKSDMSNCNGYFAEIITNKSPVAIEFFRQRDAGPVLLAYAWDKYVSLSVLHFPELEPEIEGFTYENLTDIEHGPSISKLAWSPRTSMLTHPIGIIFCTVGLDYQLRLVHVNNKMKVTIQTVGEHSSFINDCSFEPMRGNEIATVGDDKKCRIWNVEAMEQEICIPLSSSGKRVQWNPNDQNKLLIAEENGRIRMYDTKTYQPIFSLLSLKQSSGLTSADWSMFDPCKIGATIGKEWFIWDVSKGSLPVTSGPAHSGFTRDFRWTNASDNMFSTRGTPDNQVKVYSTEQDVVLMSIKTKIGNGITWHNLLPVCAVGANRKILLYDLTLR